MKKIYSYSTKLVWTSKYEVVNRTSIQKSLAYMNVGSSIQIKGNIKSLSKVKRASLFVDEERKYHNLSTRRTRSQRETDEFFCFCKIIRIFEIFK
jgi:hypothetical protein